MTKRILFVCGANKFRSVVAEYLFREMLRERDEGLAREIEVSSAGLATKELIESIKERGMDIFKPFFGRTMNDRYDGPIVDAALRKGIDISTHRTKGVNRREVEKTDLIIAMEEKQKERILYLYPEASGRIFTIGEISGKTLKLENDPVDKSPDPKDLDSYIDEIKENLREGMDKILDAMNRGF